MQSQKGLVDEQQDATGIKESSEPPSKKAKHEIARKDSGVGNDEITSAKCGGRDRKDVKDADNDEHKDDDDDEHKDDDDDDDDDCESVSAPSSPESDKWRPQNEQSKCYPSTQVLQPSIIDILRKSSSELLTSLKRYYDIK